MKVAVIGATGNLGTSVLGALGTRDDVSEIVGIARRTPDLSLPKVRWEPADISNAHLEELFQGVDCVVHLAWQIQPSHAPEVLRRTNVIGSRRVFEAAQSVGVPAVVYASSVGAYSPGPKDTYVDETWPTSGISGSNYSLHKAEVEHMLDGFEEANPKTRYVRLRPGLIFKRESAAEIAALFLGRLKPLSTLLRFGVPITPIPAEMVFQAVHASDVARACVSAVTSDVRGAFNLAAEPVLDRASIAEAFGARRVPLPSKLLRLAVDISWRGRLQPTDPGWIDMALSVPLMSTERAAKELAWKPAVGASAALAELVDGLAQMTSFPTPRLTAPNA